MEPVEALRAEIVGIYDGEGRQAYGLFEINQTQHALQAAQIAAERGFDAAMVVACLLHDVGQMLQPYGQSAAEDGLDNRHELVGARWAAERFPAEVSEPIRLHVAAKRYLCAVEPSYMDVLSRDSIVSLKVQGGPMSPAEVEAFRAEPFAERALELRRIDEMAKDKAARPPSLKDVLDRYLAASLTA